MTTEPLRLVVVVRNGQVDGIYANVDAAEVVIVDHEVDLCSSDLVHRHEPYTPTGLNLDPDLETCRLTGGLTCIY
jgi:hypothetical protein